MAILKNSGGGQRLASAMLNWIVPGVTTALNFGLPFIHALKNSPTAQANRWKSAGFSRNMVHVAPNVGNIQPSHNIPVKWGAGADFQKLQAEATNIDAATPGVEADSGLKTLNYQTESSLSPDGNTLNFTRATQELFNLGETGKLLTEQRETEQQKQREIDQNIVESRARINDLASQQAERASNISYNEARTAREQFGLTADHQRYDTEQIEQDMLRITQEYQEETIQQNLDKLAADIALIEVQTRIGSLSEQEKTAIIPKIQSDTRWTKYRNEIARRADKKGLSVADLIDWTLVSSEYVADLIGGVLSGSITNRE